MAYLDAYLCDRWKTQDPNKENKYFCGISIIIENNYVDYSYIDDYANYYSKNFFDYQKKSMRIHFFQNSTEELSSIYLFESNDKIQSLQDSYIGYIVVRPIPEFFISRACFKKWYDADTTHLFLSKEEKASLLGIDFKIDTIPFMEKDYITSVCATSALWTFFASNEFVKDYSIKNPFSITSTAMVQNECFAEDNLTPGFSIDMIYNCIKEKGLSPLLFNTKEMSSEIIMSVIHTFLSSGYPVVMGLAVYEDETDIGNEEKAKGLHAVTIVGDKYSENKLYVHDDRIGFFARLIKQDSKNYWELKYTKPVSRATESHKDEYYVPTDLVTGIYPKIRLPLSDIRKFCKFFIDDLKENISNTVESEILNYDYRIKVLSSNKLKEEIRRSITSYTNAKELIYMPLPKFCWIATFYYNEIPCFSFIFDTTDMLHSNNCLLYILYTKTVFGEIINELYKYYDNEITNGKPISKVVSKKLSPLYQFLKNQENNTCNIYSFLDDEFGRAKWPQYLKQDEFIADELKNQKPFCFKCKKDAELFNFDVSIPYYLWIIDENGYLYIGTENKSDPDSLNKGHPTLINGRKGRIGGEIHPITDSKELSTILSPEKLNEYSSVWTVNSQSGRYSWDDDNNLEKLNEFLNNAIEERFKPYFPDVYFYKQERK